MASTPSVSSVPSDSQQWQDLFQEHLVLLKEHLKTWTNIKNQQRPASKHYAAVEDCTSRTKAMIRDVEHLFNTMELERHRQPLPSNSDISIESNSVQSAATPKAPQEPTETLTLRTSKRQRSEDGAKNTASAAASKPVHDISGLFTLDANPTPVEQLLAQSVSKHGIPRNSKRSKLVNNQPDSEEVRTDDGKANQEPISLAKKSKRPAKDSRNKPEASSQASQLPSHTNNDTFLAKVEEKYQAKLERRRKAKDRKRKRSSETSVDAAASQEPRSKKKLRQSADLETRSENQPTSIPPKSNQKRSASDSQPQAKRQKRS